MLKRPVAGRVKTRLAHDIGAVNAAWWFRHQTRGLLWPLAQDRRRWDLVIALAPEGAARDPGWPCVPVIGQGRGELGRRMIHAFRQVGPGPALLIGGDIPGIRAAHLHPAHRALGQAASVLGPTPDGGYWLIGLRHAGQTVPRDLLDGVRWSTESALQDTKARLARLGPVAQAAQLRDVDTVADLRAVAAAMR